MASADSPGLKMAAGGEAQDPSDTETPGSALPERRPRERLLGYRAEGSPEEDESSAAASAQPPGEASPEALRQQRGSPQTPGQCSSQEAAERQSSKRLKTEHPGLVKSRGGLLAALVVGADEDQWSDMDCYIVEEQKGTSKEKQEKKHNVSRKPHAVESSDAPSEMESGEDVHACVCSSESSCESVLSDGSGSEDTYLPKKRVRLDSSAFLDEDSNQPMPMDQFFGDVEFLQDLPAAALPSTSMSRRECRKLHFIAKEEEEEEEDVV